MCRRSMSRTWPPPTRLASCRSPTPTLAGGFWSRDGRTLVRPQGPAISGRCRSTAATRPRCGRRSRWSRALRRRRTDRGSRSSRAAAIWWCARSTDNRESVVTRAGRQGASAASAGRPTDSPLVFTSGPRTIRHEQTPSYSGTKIIYTINENVPGDTMVIPAAGGKADADRSRRRVRRAPLGRRTSLRRRSHIA